MPKSSRFSGRDASQDPEAMIPCPTQLCSITDFTCKIVEKQEYAFMRTTIELPDPLFREVKATAARQGLRLKDYIAEALQDKLAIHSPAVEKPWMKFFGIAANDPEMLAELVQIDQTVAETFEQIEEEEWRK